MKQIILSIIIPVFNKKNYLTETVENLLLINNDSFEIIIVDDGSTDGSGKLADTLAKNQSIKVIHKENGGASSARNKGMEAAKGEWIWFVDADDIPNVEFVRSFFEIKHKNEFDIFMGDFYKVSEKETVAVTNPYLGITTVENLPDAFAELQFKNGYYGYLWNKIIRKSLIIESHTFFKEGLTLAEDLDFMISLYSYGAVCYASKVFAMKYRVNTLNSSAEKKIDYYAQLDINLKIRDWFRNVGKEEKYKKLLNKRITYYSAYIIFYANEDGMDIKEIAEQLISDDSISSSLVLVSGNDVMSKIAKFLVKGKTKSLIRYLKFRNVIRKIYRLKG
jgi:glycosyltransferase involved in cell wall biosynthesis